MKHVFGASLAIVALTCGKTYGFVPAIPGTTTIAAQRTTRTTQPSIVLRDSAIPMDGGAQQQGSDEQKAELSATATVASVDVTEQKDSPAAKPPKKAPGAAPGHSDDGIFAPVVVAAKKILGDERLNKIRAKVISMHSDVIGGFVETAESQTGKVVLRALFEVADKDKNGQVEEHELAEALKALGFEWLKEKQIHGIFERADKDQSGFIDMDEWMSEAPKTLRTNLIKLAKNNGGKMGLLA